MRAAVTGFVVGFLLAVLPAAFVTRVVAGALPLAGTVLHERTAHAFAVALATFAGIAGAVLKAARP